MGDRSRRVVVVGQGYVGLPLAMRAVEVGYTVVGFDTSEDRVKRLKSGESYVQDITSDAVDAALASGRYLPTTTADDCADFDVAVVTVPTPLTQGVPDLSHIEAAAESLGPLLRVGATVILESTTYPGTTEELMVPILERGSGLAAGRQFHVGYSPERIDPGNPIFHLWNTPKVVSGIDADSLGVVDAFCPSSSRTPSVTSTSRWSTSSPCTRASSVSASGRPSTPQRRSRSATCASPRGPASGGTASPSIPPSSHGR
jgi:nucleotide sugar dehydrogenase